MSEALVAIVGRPNVGKSTLFNRLTAARTSIEEKVPGVTRDRLYGFTEWAGRTFTVIDTGGITFGKDDRISELVRVQVNVAVEEAQVIIFLLDGREGLTSLDEEVGSLLRRSGKVIIPVINKLDHQGVEAEKFAFYKLGFGEPMAISAAHGKGTGDLLDVVIRELPEEIDKADPYDDDTVKVAVIGRPNVGKSSIVNRLLGKERVIVSQQPGTTREAVDTWLTHEGQKYLFIDTAGIRRKSKVKEDVEYYSVLRSLKAVQRADLALLLLDGEEGITEQDQKLAGYVDQIGRGLILVINKWDLAKGKAGAREEFLDQVSRLFSFIPYAPIVFLSAVTGKNIEKLFPQILIAWQEQHKRIPTALLNELLEDAIAVNPPPTVKGKRLKIYYATQPSVKPPTFVFFANEPELMHFSYLRYLENRLRDSFGFTGTPVILKLKKRQRRGE